MYICDELNVFNKDAARFSLNITGRGELGSTCFILGCATFDSDSRSISSNMCVIGELMQDLYFMYVWNIDLLVAVTCTPHKL